MPSCRTRSGTQLHYALGIIVDLVFRRNYVTNESSVGGSAWQDARRAKQIAGPFNRRATQSCGMDQRMKMLFLDWP
jgi:hypothetical protein